MPFASKKFDPASENKLNYKAIGIIVILTIFYQIYLSEIMLDTDELQFASIAYGLSILVAGIFALYVAKKYRGSEIFGVTYASLGIGLLLLFVGDTIYLYYEHVLEEDPYPSIADVFFIVYYPFTAYHLIRNIGYFKKDFSLPSKLFVPGLTLAIVFIFAFISFDEIDGHSFDFYFGMIFVFGSSLILSLAILGVTVFRRSVLGVAWLLLAVGLFLFTFADVWYYYLELVGEYYIGHFIDTLWITSNMIIVYALYKHKKII